MRITIVQTRLQWEDGTTNRTLLAEKMKYLQGRTDVVVLPEMFTTGFSMRATALSEPLEGPTVAWMAEQAAFLNAALTGSFICCENKQYFNRLVWMYPNGDYLLYDKKHLFALAGEHEHYTPGQQRLLVKWQDWTICPLVCYDLRFPEWSRNTLAAPYDLLLYVANWPARRARHWQALLTARAIENQCFTVGVNICGTDGQGLEYQGDSCIVDYVGRVLVSLTAQEGIFTATLDRSLQQAYRQQLPFLV